MKLQINITIVKNGEQGYICECDYPFENFILGGAGKTVQEAKDDCFEFYNEMKEIYPNQKFKDLDVKWLYDLPSFFNTFSYFNLTQLAKKIGINPSNFRHYTAGSKPVTKKQLEKVQNAFQQIAFELKQNTETMLMS